MNLFEDDAQIEFPAEAPITPQDFFQSSPTLDVSGLTSSDWCTSCVFNLRLPETTHHGVAFCRFDPRSKRIQQSQFYWNS